jgi:site-specific DNA-cytosine methylase
MKKWVSVKEALGLDGIIEDRKSTFGELEYRKYQTQNPSHSLLVDSRDFFISNSGHTTQNRENITRSINEPSDTIVVSGNAQITNYEIKSLKYIRNKNPIMFEKHKPNYLDEPSYTLNAKDRATPSEMITDGTYCRKLENHEIAILQGFPNDYKWFGGKSSVRKQVGNAVPPPLIRAFGEMLKNMAQLEHCNESKEQYQ